jgi:hypothetical protein
LPAERGAYDLFLELKPTKRNSAPLFFDPPAPSIGIEEHGKRIVVDVERKIELF